MARVVFLATQRRHTGGVAEIDLAARDFRALAAAISARFPGFPGEELERCTVAIDGEIVDGPLLETLRPDSRVMFVPRIGAG
jgi:hypothetical protein